MHPSRYLSSCPHRSLRETAGRGRLALRKALAGGIGLLVASGCGELPEVRYETRFIDLATDFDTPVCRGTRVALDDRFEYVASLRRDERPDRMLLYWVDHDIERVCSGEKLGCFIPGTRVAAAYQPALHHEVVHAVLDTRGRNVFVEEGLAEYLGGYPVVFDPDRGAPLRELGRGDHNGEDAGPISYPEAASFAHFLGRIGGDELLSELVAAIDGGVSGATIERLLERELDEPRGAIEVNYRQEMTTVIPGLSRQNVESIDLDALPGTRRFSLECASGDTLGPLDPARAEGFQVYSVWNPGETTFEWKIDGPPGAWAAIAPVYDRRTKVALDWLAPDLGAIEHQLVRPEDGIRRVELSRGEHALILVVPADAQYDIHLQVDHLRTVYTGPHRDERPPPT